MDHNDFKWMIGYNRDKANGTQVVLPTISFVDKYIINLANLSIEVLYLGPARFTRRYFGMDPF